jgi:preprotein translocase subunit SecD
MGSDGYKELRYSEQDKLNLTAEPRIEFTLTPNGKKKLEDFTKNNLKKSVAVIGDNRILAKVMIMEPISSGKIQIIAPTNSVNEMAKLVESIGLKLKVKSAGIQ